jgi:hypothetical protein
MAYTLRSELIGGDSCQPSAIKYASGNWKFAIENAMVFSTLIPDP